MLKNLIIGAGPAGLAVAGRMRMAGMDFQILEKSQNVGNAWHGHYDRLHLHTVKQWSHLPGMAFPEDYPLYVPREQLISYFEKYAHDFDIRPQFEEQVVFIKKSKNGTWTAETEGGELFEAENIIIATGVNRVPNMPKWKGEENFKGEIIHSKFYKNPKPFLGKKVMVVGMGNTGAEVAFDLSQFGVKTYLSVRGKVSIVPRDLNGRPVQVTGKLLEKIPFGLGDFIGTQIRKLYFGNLARYGLNIDTTPPARLLKESGKTPVIDIGTVKAIKEGKIKVVGEIDEFTKHGVRLKSGEEKEVDVILAATGFRAQVEDFLERGAEVTDKFGCPSPPVGGDYHEGIYFVGFDNYKLGGILGTIFTDSKIVVEHISKK